MLIKKTVGKEEMNKQFGYFLGVILADTQDALWSTTSAANTSFSFPLFILYDAWAQTDII